MRHSGYPIQTVPWYTVVITDLLPLSNELEEDTYDCAEIKNMFLYPQEREPNGDTYRKWRMSCCYWWILFTRRIRTFFLIKVSKFLYS